jgi:hypothetical protein
MNDTAVGGAAIVPTAAGYSIPLVSYYFDQATGTASPVTILNASNAKIETAPWTQATATISEQDKQAIADSSAAEVWTAPTRTLTSGGGGGGGGATAQQVWEYADRTLTAAIPTAAQNASAVRTELATELARVDVATSTRLATAGYTAPANADITAIKAKTDRMAFNAQDHIAANVHQLQAGAVTAISAGLLDATVEAGTSVVQSMRLTNAVLLGKVSGAGTGTETFRDVNDTKNRVISSVDAQGNRTGAVLDGS